MTDGVLFGDRCERRVFFPATQAVNANNVDVIANANADASIVSRAASPNLLAALGLVAPSPYVALKCSTNSSSSSSSGTCRHLNVVHTSHRGLRHAHRRRHHRHHRRAWQSGTGCTRCGTRSSCCRSWGTTCSSTGRQSHRQKTKRKTKEQQQKPEQNKSHTRKHQWEFVISGRYYLRNRPLFGPNSPLFVPNSPLFVTNFDVQLLYMFCNVGEKKPVCFSDVPLRTRTFRQDATVERSIIACVQCEHVPIHRYINVHTRYMFWKNKSRIKKKYCVFSIRCLLAPLRLLWNSVSQAKGRRAFPPTKATRRHAHIDTSQTQKKNTRAVHGSGQISRARSGRAELGCPDQVHESLKTS